MCTIHRQPKEDDFCTPSLVKSHGNIADFERFFNEAIKNRDIVPGQLFTELELSTHSHCPTHIVREFLLRFSRFNLVNNIERGRWEMAKFEQSYADNLFELREMLECHALSRFMNLPRSDSRWHDTQYLLQEHRDLREKVIYDYQQFSDLDHKFHMLILSAANNPFMEQFYDIISVIFHYHYQWDNSDLRTRNMIAVEEHMAILSKILSFDDIGAMSELRRHLHTAKTSMANSLITEHSPVK
ncbi:GntR family transcriptional regulator [Vibrio sp. PP-XX7]